MRVDFYYDIVCPYAYLAHTQIEAACARHGAELSWKPILLGGLFRAVRGDDGPMPNMPAAKRRMNLLDMMRWAEHWEVPLVLPEAHPRRTVLAMRTIVASRAPVAAAKALFLAYWRDGLDVASETVVAEVLDGAGDHACGGGVRGDDSAGDHACGGGNWLVGRAAEAAVKEDLVRRTEEARLAGAFGVPTFVVHGKGDPELFWGQDRIGFVEQLLASGGG
ncbi:MAG: 2-hydroxychromene-2-carboxylate isomerase [Myxococcales bacterium]|nr:2-hydroxychromene-2-carboxylate isomerase [Myxococcales bacterium]